VLPDCDRTVAAELAGEGRNGGKWAFVLSMGCMYRTEPPRHGAVQPGQSQASGQLLEPARFGRLFEDYPVVSHQDEHLRLLARTMLAPAEPDKPLGVEDEDENTSIPAGYTYLGQFIDHDITFDPVSNPRRQNNPAALVDFRTPRFDLDAVYGRGPADEPYLYSPEDLVEVDGQRLRTGAGLKFLLGPPTATAARSTVVPDLPRNTVLDIDTGTWGPGRALIGDPRNDENLVISQLHRTFLQFHNAVVDDLLRKEVQSSSVATVQIALDRGELADKLFSNARRLVRWHYQWVIVHDFLPRICGTIVEDMFRAGGTGGRPQLTFYSPVEGKPFIPVEFSVAAYRFGHSMVRPSYFTSDAVRTQRMDHGSQPLRTPILGPSIGPALANLDGFRPLPEAGGIEWKYFFPNLGDTSPDGKSLPQPSYKIDTQLVYPLGDLPFPVVSNGSHSLAERNLVRGRSVGLPTGQCVAERMGITPLSDELLELTNDKLTERLDRVGAVETAELIRRAVGEFAGNAPLWYYILREAELAGGARLGEVGGRIVAEVLLGLLDADPESYLRAAPDWRPTFVGEGGIDKSGEFDMTALIRFATSQQNTTHQQRNTIVTLSTSSETNHSNVGTDLARFILEGVPYRYDPDNEPKLVLNGKGPAEIESVKDGPAKDFGENQRLAKTASEGITATLNDTSKSPLSEDWIRDYPWESLWWHFDGKSHRVVKAVRIAYEVIQEGTPVTKHILIGYEGIDPMG
jgi:hypothetical protein